MRHLALGFGAALALGACVVPDDLSSTEQPIIGGQQAQISEFPTLSLLEDNEGWFCAGVLIDKDWVLTTAGCLLGESAGSMNLRFDDNNVNDGGGRRVNIAQLQRNPGFNNDFPNDIALIKLAQSITDKVPTPILRTPVAINTMTTQAGWGENGNGAGNLRKLTTPTDDCGEIGFNNTNNLCFDATDGNASCYGDAGAPAFVTVNGKVHVAGVMSSGTAQSCTQGFSVFTATAGYLAFIDMYVPKIEDPTDPVDPMDPMDPTDPLDPKTPTQDPDAGRDFNQGGCSAGGASGGWLLALGLAALFVRRRRRGA